MKEFFADSPSWQLLPRQTVLAQCHKDQEAFWSSNQLSMLSSSKIILGGSILFLFVSFPFHASLISFGE